MRKHEGLYEKLEQAISSSMFITQPEYVADVFRMLSEGLDDVRRHGDLDDEQAREWLATIRSLITPSDEDVAAARAARDGAFFVRAERMTNDERLTLARAMWELHGYLSAS